MERESYEREPNSEFCLCIDNCRHYLVVSYVVVRLHLAFIEKNELRISKKITARIVLIYSLQMAQSMNCFSSYFEFIL